VREAACGRFRDAVGGKGACVSRHAGTRGIWRTRRPLALAYHAIADDWDDPLAVTEERFTAQILHLSAAGYTGVRFTELAHASGSRPLVAITFDDAFSSVRGKAFPLLERLGWPATVFASASVVDAGLRMTWLLGEQGRQPREASTLQPLSWDELRFLHARGWEVGSHGATHRRLSSLGSSERAQELAVARTRIEAEVGPCSAISYPWGEVVDDVVEEAVRAGHTAGGGLEGRFEQHDPMRVPRFAVSRRDGALRFAAKTSPTVASVRRTAVWTGLDRVRHRDYEPLGDADARRDVLRG
jgi:peptidoglycan/xylan/chitin deacetylase (PgdA/CDA1 family)